MDVNKTKIFVVDGNETPNNSTEAYAKESFVEYKAKTEKINALEESKALKNINPNASYFPSFYSREIKRNNISFILWNIYAVVLIGLILTASLLTIKPSDNQTLWLLIVYIIPVLIFIPLYVSKLLFWSSLRNEAKTINFKDQKVVSINITKLYKRLKVTYINANWFCSLAYIYSFAGVIVLVIVCWGVKSINGINIEAPWSSWNVNPFRFVLTPVQGAIPYFISFLVFTAIFVIAALVHATSITTAMVRVNRIENFYNSFIVLPEELEAYKKKVNKRDLICFCVALLIIGLIIYFSYKNAKKNRQTVVVNQ